MRRFVLSAAQGCLTPPAWLCTEPCRKMQLEAAAVGRRSAAGLLHLAAPYPTMTARERAVYHPAASCQLCLENRLRYILCLISFGSPLCCSDVSKAQSRWTQPVWLCPEPRSKFQLWDFATGTRSAAGLRIRTAGPSTPQPPSPKTFQSGARWELIPGCCLALDSARLPPFVFAMLLLLILGDSAFMALCTHLAHLAAMAGDGVGYSTFRKFRLACSRPFSTRVVLNGINRNMMLPSL